MNVQVKLFAAAREQAGVDSIELNVASEARVQDLLEALKEIYPGLKGVTGRWAVNREFVSLDHAVHEEDDVAFIPPVSGG